MNIHEVNTNEIKKIRKHISNAFPHAKKIEVKISGEKNGIYKSKIRVLAPQKKELIAVKTDDDPKRCLEKTHHAIIKQIHRAKTRWKRKSNRGVRKLLAA